MSSRKEFLGAGAVAALVPALGAAPASSPSASPSPAPEPTFPPLNFDLAAFDAACARPAAHRHMFASTLLSDGRPLDAIKTVFDVYTSLGVAASAVATSAVLYHGASICLALNDDVWRTILLPAIPKMQDGPMRKDLEDYKSGSGNPFRQSKKPGGVSYELVAAQGTLFYVCNEAAKGFASFLSKLNDAAPLETYAAIVKGLLPSASLVPAGVWAIHAIQERGFTYLRTTP
ncbi:MAG: hypothetical protein JO199_11540 [Candidatus Eremiobacteraeota bacterium]|nr:hypothetical protein [Candidatus Eremiobacteraeota bacterium]